MTWHGLIPPYDVEPDDEDGPDDRENLTEVDWDFREHGTLVTLHPRNDYASEWIQDNLYDEQGNGPMLWGDGFVIEPRYFETILEDLLDRGDIVRRLP